MAYPPMITLLDCFHALTDKHSGGVPTDSCDLAGGDLDLFAGKTMAGLDDQLAQGPSLVVHHEITHVAGSPVARLQEVTRDGLGAAQMRVGGFGRRPRRRGGCGRKGFRGQFQNGKTAQAPQAVALPVVRPAVVAVILFFILSRHRFVRVDGRAVLDLVAGQVDEEGFAGVMKFAKGVGREQHFTPRQPGTGVGDQVAHHPVLVVEIEVLHVADFAIRGSEFIAVELFETA